MVKNLDFLVHSENNIELLSSEIALVERNLEELKNCRSEMIRENHIAKRQQEIKNARKMTAARAAVLEELVKTHSGFYDGEKQNGIPQTVTIHRNWGSYGHYARFNYGYFEVNPRPQVIEDLYEAKYIYCLKNADNFRSNTYAISDDGCEALDAWRKKQEK